MPATQQLPVANGEGGSIEAFKATGRGGTLDGLPDADNLRLDSSSGRLYAGFGGGLAVVDAATLRLLGRMSLPGHPEAFELSPIGPEAYVNVPSVGAVVVVDRRTGKETARWSVAPAARNFPMSLDATHGRLFVATRVPPQLQVFDIASGRRVAQRPLCGDADDLFLDAVERRRYAVCGDGHVVVLEGRDGDRYELVQTIPTSPGARTGLLVAAMKRLFVAAPGSNGRPAAVLVYRID